MANTIMFIHGMFLNSKSWERWNDFFQSRGFDCVAPEWPCHEGEPAELRTHVPPGLGELSLQAVIDSTLKAAARYEDLILVGHSVGGLIVQKLISLGVGRLGIPVCSVAPNRMLSLDWGFLRNSVSITNPLKGNEPFPMDADGFYKNFGNAMPRAQSDAAFLKYGMPESRNVLRDCLGDTGKIDLTRRHPPLLFIGAQQDEIIPPSLCEKNAQAYTHESYRPDYQEFKGRGHFICGQAGWEEVAGSIHSWIRSKGLAAVA